MYYYFCCMTYVKVFSLTLFSRLSCCYNCSYHRYYQFSYRIISCKQQKQQQELIISISISSSLFWYVLQINHFHFLISFLKKELPHYYYYHYKSNLMLLLFSLTSSDSVLFFKKLLKLLSLICQLNCKLIVW